MGMAPVIAGDLAPKRKSVLYLAHFDPTVTSYGTAVRGGFIVRFLAKRYDTHLVYFRDEQGLGRSEASVATLASASAVERNDRGFFLFSRSFYRKACEILQRWPVDFICADTEKSGLYASLLSRRFQKPYFYLSANVEYLKYRSLAREKPMRLPFVPYVYLVERRACREALSTFVISDRDAETFRSWAGDDKVSTLPMAFDEGCIHPFYEDAPSDPPVVLMVGNFGYGGNREGVYQVYRKVLPAVLARHPEAVFRFVGKDFPSDVQHPRIQAAGFVEDLLGEYRRATIVLAPVTLGGGIKIKVIEALAAGKFLVATPKAMEGIDAAEMENLVVVPLESFAAPIVEALTRRPGKTTRNWERIVNGYGIRAQLETMQARMEAALAVHGRR